MIRPSQPNDYKACLELLGKYSYGTVENWGQTFVCEVNKEVIGFVCCRLYDEYLPLGLTRKVGRLEPIVIEPDNSYALYRLVERAYHYFQDLGATVVEGLVRADNDKLIAYLKEEFGAVEAAPASILVRKDI
jgi:hypothetical protein